MKSITVQALIFLSTIFFMNQLVPTPAASAGLPRKPGEPASVIAIGQFASRDYLTDYQALATGLSNLLIAELSHCPGVNLVERTRIQKVLDEAGLSLANLTAPENAVRLGKMAGADMVVTGYILSVKGERIAVVKAINPGRGVVSDVQCFRIEPEDLMQSVDEIRNFVLSCLKVDGVPRSRKIFSVGAFNPLGANSGLANYGDVIRSTLEMRYAGTPDMKMLARSLLIPLIYEQRLQDAGLTPDREKGEAPPHQIVLIDGDYSIDRTISVRLNTTIVGAGSRVYALQAGTWDEMFSKLGDILDGYFCIKREPTGRSEAEQADTHYESGRKLSGLSFTESPFAGKYVGTHHFGEDLLHGQYQANTPETRRQENISGAMDHFRKALQLDPNHYRAMLLLACCLERYGRYDAHMRVTPQDFSEMTRDVDTLYTELIEKEYIGPNGEVLEKFWKMSPVERKSALPKGTADILSIEQIGKHRARELLETVIMAADEPDLRERAINELCRPFGFSYEKEQLEAEHHFQRGKLISRLDYRKNNRKEVTFPPVIVGGMAPDESASIRRKNLQDAIDEFEAAIYLNPDYYEAMLFLAICLDMAGERSRANGIFEQVIAEAPYDAMRFIAAKRTGTLGEIEFTQAFCQEVSIKRKIRKFYEDQLKTMLYGDSGNRVADRLHAILQKALFADCEDRCQTKAMDLFLKKGGEFQLTDSLQKDIFSRLENRYPDCVPNLIACVTINENGLSPGLRETLTAMEEGAARPRDRKRFYKELGKRLDECLAGALWEDAISIGNHMRNMGELDFYDHVKLARAYYETGRHQQTVNCLSQLVYADFSPQKDGIRGIHRLGSGKPRILLQAAENGYAWFKELIEFRDANKDCWFTITRAISADEVLVDMATRDELLWFCTNPKREVGSPEEPRVQPRVYRYQKNRSVVPVKLPFPFAGDIVALEVHDGYLLINTEDGCLKLGTDRPDFLFFDAASDLPEGMSLPVRCDIEQQVALFFNPPPVPRFLDENDYYASGFLDDRVQGIYRHKGTAANGYPCYENQGNGYQVKYADKGLGCWVLVDANGGVLYRSMPAKENQLPDFSAQWCGGTRLTPQYCSPNPCPGLMEKLSSVDASEIQPPPDPHRRRPDCPDDGICVDYYPQGSVKSKRGYRAGQLQGTALTYYREGQIYEKADYVDGRLSGVRQIFFKNGRLFFEGNYQSGAPHGKQYCYTSDEVVSAACTYYQGNFQNRLSDVVGRPKNGIHCVYYDFDKTRVKSKVQYAGLLRNGPAVRNYTSGAVFERIAYEDDLLHGHAEKYYPQGERIAATDFVGGLQNGIYRTYHRNGAIFLEVPYKAGKISGTHKKYYADGTLFREHNYGLDQNRAIIREFYKNGQLLFESIYDKDTENGVFRFYTPEGRLCHQAEYDGRGGIPPESKTVAELQWYRKHWDVRLLGGWNAMIRNKTRIKELYYEDLEIVKDIGVYTETTAPYYPDASRICICSFDKRAVQDAKFNRVGCILNQDGWNGKWQFGK